MSLDIEDLRLSNIEMPIISNDYSVDELCKFDNILSNLSEDISLDPIKLMRENRCSISLLNLLHRYYELLSLGKISENKDLEFKLMRKKSRGHSGVEVIAVSTYPEGKYVGCPANCHYCPKEPSKDFNVRVISYELKEKLILLNVEHIDNDDYFYTKVINHIFWEGKKIYIIQSISVKKSVILKLNKNDFDNYPECDTILKVHKTAQPRSYLSSEPAVSRANQNGWDCVSQFRDIAGKRIICGHNVTKVEGIVIGGTWSYYPNDYQMNFIRDFYYAANTLYDNIPLRKRKSLEEEIKLNESTRCRIIGLTLETRPDFINKSEIVKLREYGCTRVQLGVQHVDDNILSYINRGCSHKKSVNAIRMLKDAGFKVDIHLMPDLPGSNFEKDVKMFEYILKSDEMQVDQWKIYPCQTMEYSKIKEWYDSGKYKPYFETEKVINFDNIYLDKLYKKSDIIYFISVMIILLSLFLKLTFNKVNYDFNIVYINIFPMIFIILKICLEFLCENYISNPLFHLLVHFIPKVHPWIRLNRIVRDNPKHHIVGGLDQAHYRNVIEERLKKTGNKSQDIREREIKGREYDANNIKLVRRSYMGSRCKEYFLSFEDIKNNYILGFLRLRLPKKTNNHYLKELNNCSLIRELHVYGWMVPQGRKSEMVQHRGFGMSLVREAERISKLNGYNKIAVISGVGVREYYNKKLDYKLDGSYMTKLI